MALKLGLFAEGIYCSWGSLNTGRRTNPILIYNLIQFLSNLSKIIPGQKPADIILQIQTLAKVKKSGKLTKIVQIEEVNFMNLY